MINAIAHKKPVKDVLIVDDEESFLKTVTDGVTSAMPSLHLITASNGRQALEVLRAAVMDLVITDLKMPVMDGFQFIEYMRDCMPQIDVIAMSPLDGPEVRDRLNRLGVNRLIVKPFDLSTLLNVIKGADPSASAAGRVAAMPAKGLNILFMDDEPSLRTVTGLILEGMGHDVSLAGCGEEAIRHFIEARQIGDPYDVVIFDLIVRGGMGGDEAVRMLREVDPRVPAILVSGAVDHAVFRDFAAYGFCCALEKPYTADQLHSAIHRAVENAALRARLLDV